MSGPSDSPLPLEVVRLDTVDSTNTHLYTLMEAGAPAGTCVIAGEQTGGRGQPGRTWFSPPGSFYLSIALTCRNARCLVFGLPWVLARTLFYACRLQAGCRWPNDVVVESKKIGGVLIESSPLPGVWIAGCGVNINVPSFPEELSGIATSAQIETKTKWPLQGALGFEDTFFLHLNYLMNEIAGFQLLGALALWRPWDVTPGSLIRVKQGDAEKLVEAVVVDELGRLVTKDGERYEVVVSASAIEWVRTGPPSES